MAIGLDESVRLATEQVLAVFVSPRTSSTLLGIPVDETTEVARSAEAGGLMLEDLGLSRDDVEAALLRRAPVPGEDPEITAIKTAYVMIAVHRDRVVEALREMAPSGPRL